MNNLKLNYCFLFYLLILPLNSFSSPNLENLVVGERFGEIVQKVEAITDPSWQDSFYAGYAHFKLGNLSLANLYISKSLLENPLEEKTVVLAEAIHQKLSGKSSVELITAYGKKNIGYVTILLFLLCIITIFWRREKLRLFISTLGLVIIFSGGFFLQESPLFAKRKIGVLGPDSSVRFSPSNDSTAKIDFGKESLFMVVRKVGNWSYVKNLSGRSGWVNKGGLITLK